MVTKKLIHKSDSGETYEVDIGVLAENVETDATRQFVTSEEKTNIAEIPNLKKSVSDGKGLIAAAITAKEIAASATDTFAQLAEKIKKIVLGSGNATKADVLAGKTFTNSDGVEYTGTMPNCPAGQVASKITPYDNHLYYLIPKGAYITTVKENQTEVKAPYSMIATALNLTAAKLLAGQTVCGVTGTATNDATAVAANILKGKTAYIKGLKVTGTMKNLSSETTIKHDASNSTPVLVCDTMYVSTNTDNIKRLQFRYMGSEGYVSLNTLFGYPLASVASGLGITAEKIKHGHAIAGVSGNFTSDGTAVAANIVQGKVAYSKGNRLVGTLVVNSALSFSIAAISSTEIEIYWTNPAKGPFSGIFVQMATSGYPGSSGGTRKYTGMGTNKNPSGKSSCKISGLNPNTKYYFTVTSYCDGLAWGTSVNLTATTKKAQGQQILTTGSTFTVPAGVTALDIFAVGGGAAGTYAHYETWSGQKITGGGGGSGYTKRLSPVGVTPGEKLSVVIGAGGVDGGVGSKSGVYRNGTALIEAGYGSASGNAANGANGGSGGGAAGGTVTGSDYHNLGTAGAGGSNGGNGSNGSFQTQQEGDDYPDTRNTTGGAGQGTSTVGPDGKRYAGGGGGFYKHTRGYGSKTGGSGADGGGNGASGATGAAAGNATAGTGSGGGGGDSNAGLKAGNGGSGVVIIRWGYT